MRANENGFTLIELLYAVSILGILASTMWGFFSLYKEEASYGVAETALKQARTALEIGDAEAETGTSVAYTQTGTGGGLVSNPLLDVMPGYTTPNDVRIGVTYRKCAGPGDPGINHYVVAEPCNAEKQARHTRFCSGIELIQADVPQAKGCS